MLDVLIGCIIAIWLLATIIIFAITAERHFGTGPKYRPMRKGIDKIKVQIDGIYR